jgi:uncharacterized protein YkwD
MSDVVPRALILMAVLMAAPGHAAGLVPEVNTIRMQGCKGQPGVGVAVRQSASLDEVARQLSRVGRLSAALEHAGYEAESSASIHLDGTTELAALGKILREQYCATVNNAAFSEIGVFRRGAGSWLVLADPFSPPDPADQEAVARQVLALVNAARQEARKCGRQKFPATHPLQLSATLSRAALAHARDMAAHRSLDHRGADGSQPAQRVTRAGYAWRTTAENIAAGQPGAAAVVAHWLDSPGHCANLMGAQYTEMGVAFTIEPQSRARIYWAQVFAAPRQLLQD